MVRIYFSSHLDIVYNIQFNFRHLIYTHNSRHWYNSFTSKIVLTAVWFLNATQDVAATFKALHGLWAGYLQVFLLLMIYVDRVDSLYILSLEIATHKALEICVLMHCPRPKQYPLDVQKGYSLLIFKTSGKPKLSHQTLKTGLLGLLLLQ